MNSERAATARCASDQPLTANRYPLSPWSVYIVRCADDTLYTGIAIDVSARVAAHNDGRGAKYTRSRRPVALVHVEAVGDRGAALRREHEIKSLDAADKRRLLAQARA
jgi:putative endonuclease